MKRIISVMLAAIIVLACFSGCCLKHDYLPATCEAPETCSKCGKTQGEALGHTWKDATCTEPQTCEVCAKTQGEALGHSWKDATCTEPKTCKVCGTTSGSAKGHSWKDATCTKPKTCKVCGETTGSTAEHNYSSTTGLCYSCGAAKYTLDALQSEYLSANSDYAAVASNCLSRSNAKSNKSKLEKYHNKMKSYETMIRNHPDFSSSSSTGKAWISLFSKEATLNDVLTNPYSYSSEYSFLMRVQDTVNGLLSALEKLY